MIDNASVWKQALEQSRSAFGYHEMLVNNQGQAVDYVYLDVNQAFCNMTGLKREEVLGRKCSEVMKTLGQDASFWINRFTPVALHGEKYRQEFYDNRSDLWWEIEAFCSASRFFIAIAHDITLQKQNTMPHCHHFINSNILFCLLDLDSGCFTDLNPCWHQTLGWPREMLLGHPLMDFVHPDDRLLISDGLEKLRRNQSIEGLEARVLCGDGSNRCLLWQARADADAGLIYTSAVDITERVVLKTELERVNRLYAVLSDTNHEIVRKRPRPLLLKKVCDAAVKHGGFVMAWVGRLDRESGRIIPVAHAGINNDYLDEISVSYRDEPYDKGPTGMAINTGQIDVCSDIELDARMGPWLESARKRGYRSSAAVPILENNIITYVFNVYALEPGFFGRQEQRLLIEIGIDIGYALAAMQASEERNHFEQEWLLSEARYCSLFEQSPAGLYLYDKDLVFSECNQSFADLSQQPADAINGRSMRSWTESGMIRAAEDALNGLEGWYEGPYKSGYEGSPVWISMQTAPLFDHQGIIIGGMGIVSDISAIKQAEAEILRLNEVLEQRVAERTADLLTLNQELESFSYSVSHDLRSPLRAIGGYASIISEDFEDDLNDDIKRMLGLINRNTKRMGMLIDDLLAFSKLGRQSKRPKFFDMERLFNDAFNELSAEQGELDSVKKRSIEFSVDQLPVAYGDLSMIRQLVNNLLSNAIKFTGQRSEACIQVGCLPAESAGQQVFFVRDNGAGFDPRYIDKIFNVFQRLHHEEEFEGTGVGLAISRRIVERHGGRIWAEGKPGEGATFYFSLPCGEEKDMAPRNQTNFTLSSSRPMV